MKYNNASWQPLNFIELNSYTQVLNRIMLFLITFPTALTLWTPHMICIIENKFLCVGNTCDDSFHFGERHSDQKANETF